MLVTAFMATAVQATQQRRRLPNLLFYLSNAICALLFVYGPSSSISRSWTEWNLYVVAAVMQLAGYFLSIYLVVPDLPEPLGPYRIGFKEILVPAKNPNDHPIPVEVIYPTSLKSSSAHKMNKKLRIYPHAMLTAKAISRYNKAPWIFFEHWGAAEAEYDAQENVIEIEQKKLPVVVFSHGLCGDPGTYSVIRRAIASFGFVVFAPTHNDGSANVIRYVDGTHRSVELLADDPSKIELNWRRQQVFHRRDEINTVLDYLMNNEGRLVFQKKASELLDFDRVGIAGHSFGAATSLTTAASNPKLFKCVIDLDGWMLPVPTEVVESGLEAPMLILMTEHFTNLHDIMDPQIAMFNRSPNPANLMGVLFGTVHIDFSDSPLYFHEIVNSRNKKKLTKLTTGKESLKYTCALATWFLRKHLAGEPTVQDEESFMKSFLDENIRLLKQGLSLKDLRKQV